ncbi:unnamed protein product [Phaedon cochleariae]|uniref:Cuticular protein n=1 Tax=Phaedon cochleariae TaxID=80249 RepID=A0A9N9SCG3_PHACE|nr:unnamed protein product [Phaedon cochleariae]
MQFENEILWYLLLSILIKTIATDDEFNVLHEDGSFEFGYNNPDSYHFADANRKNVVKGQFGGRNPGTGEIDSTIYTAGPRGFRPRGKNVVRKYDLNQSGPRAIGSRDDPYYDPYEDPSYKFGFRTRTYTRDENANRVGDVNGRYSYIDDVGEKHNVEFIAGKNTGFHVKTPFPDSNPRAYGPLYFRGRGKPIPRGRTSIQRGLDGSYKFVSAGPDQRRTETSDSTGHVRGSYTYLDDKGVQHSVHYIAGPETGYRVLKQVKGPHLPTVFPFERPDLLPPDYYDYDKDLFDGAASGHVKPSGKPGSKGDDNGLDDKKGVFSFGNKVPSGAKPGATFAFGDGFGHKKPFGPKPGSKPSYVDEDTDDDDFGDIFGSGPTSTSPRPASGVASAEDDGSYKPSYEDGSYKPSTTTSRPAGRPTRPGVRPPSRPAADSAEDLFGVRPGSSSTPRPGYGNGGSSEAGYGSGIKPIPDFEDGYPPQGAQDDFGLFGSETSHPRPPYGSGAPTVTVGGANANCPICPGTIVTNVGDRTFLVPPGVSVRAHVQAIDLIPNNPSVPSPSEQFNADMALRTEQLNADEDNIISKAKNSTTTEEPKTQELSTTLSSTDTTTGR